ncbi:Lactose transport system permease protein LacF [subsurface metagenome]
MGKADNNKVSLSGGAGGSARFFSGWYRRHRDGVTAWLLLGPILVYFLILQGFPIIFGFLLGFFRWVGVTTTPEFCGLANYLTFFTEPMYLLALWRAFYIGSLVMLVNVGVGFGGALLLNLPIRGRGVFRTIWYIPVVTSTVATSQMFLIFIDPSVGVANRVLEQLGLTPVVWFYSTFWMVVWIVLYSSWRGIGFTAILWLAGLQAIDPGLYEAAQIDGAGGWQKFWYITIPGLKTIAIFVLVTGFIGALQIFDPVLFISQGMPWGTTEVIIYRIFRDFYGDFNFGMAGAGSVIVALIIVAFTVATFRLLGERRGL